MGYSKIESEIFKLNVGRVDVEVIDEREIAEFIKDGAYDLVRIKTGSADEMASDKLAKTGFPFYFSGGIRRYRVNVWEAPLPELLNPSLRFELYIGEEGQKTVLRDVIRQTWGRFPLGYYRTPVINKLVDREMELEALTTFYLENNNNRTAPDNYMWTLYDGDLYVGFIALFMYKKEKMVDSTIASTLPAYRKAGYFIDILRFIRRFCREHELDYFTCGARSENHRSQQLFEREHMICIDSQYVYHMVPMLGKAR